MRHLVVMHKTRAGYCAGAPDVPGCVATGATREETESRFREALGSPLRARAPVRHRPLDFSTWWEVMS